MPFSTMAFYPGTPTIGVERKFLPSFSSSLSVDFNLAFDQEIAAGKAPKIKWLQDRSCRHSIIYYVTVFLVKYSIRLIE